MITSSPSILIVEDEYLIALDIEQELRARGFSPIAPVSDLDAALRLVETSDLAAAVLDMNLVEGTTFPVADALHARKVPYLFLSGNDSSMLAPHLRDQCVLPKPVDYDLLEAELRKLIEI